MGRPTKLNEDVQARIIEGIRAGAHLDIAAAHGGVHYATFRNWMTKGEKASSGVYREFFDAVTRAEDQTELLAAGTIVQAFRGQRGNVVDKKTGEIVEVWIAPPDWHAAEAWLKRRHPERWAQTVKMTGADGGPIQHDVSTREQALAEGRERATKLRAV